MIRESRHLGLGGYGLGGYGYLQIIYSIRILYLRLIYLSNILRLSCGYGCGLGLGGFGGGFGNYFHGHGGHWRSDSDDGQFQFTDRTLNLQNAPNVNEQY